MRVRSTTGKALAAISLILAATPVVAGCQEAGGGITRPPATFGPSPFGPSPCPPGWQRLGDGCLITGTLGPGQNLPLPTISGTPVPWPLNTPAGSLGQS